MENGYALKDRISPIRAANLTGISGIKHGFFTRSGGVSQGIYRALNCGWGSMDRREDVAENRRRAARAFGLPSESMLTPRQIHSAASVSVSVPWDQNEAPEADAIVTATPGIMVGVLAADCVPVLLADGEAGVVAAAHAGWKGAKAGIIDAVVAAMEKLGAARERIAAAIGPAISQPVYEVGREFMEAFTADDADYAKYFSIIPGQSRPHFDLPGFVCACLTKNSVTKIWNSELCTYQNESLFYSYRRSVHRGEPDYGRQISAIVIA